jgi:hypothetical protein
MSDKEKMTAIIGIRVYPSWKKQMMEEAREKGETLSQYIYDLIETGSKGISKDDVKQGSEKEPVKTQDC